MWPLMWSVICVCWMRGGDRAPLPVTAKERSRLMPDSHNPMCESWVGDVLALDRFPDDRGLSRPALIGKWRNFRRGLNLIPRGDTYPQGRQASRTAISALNQIRMR